MKIEVDTCYVPVNNLFPNTGQIEGVPANPRKIDRKKLQKLADSLKGSEQLLDLRPLIVYRNPNENRPAKNELVVIAGNMRLAAAKLASIEQVHCHIIEKCDSARTLREIAIKDNLAFGKDDYDLLMEEWDREELDEWGLEIVEAEKPEKKQDSDDKPESVDIVITVPMEDSESTVAFLASNGYECTVKPRKKKK